MAHIIVIDDDKTLLQLIKNTLEKEHSVTVYRECLFEKSMHTI